VALLRRSGSAGSGFFPGFTEVAEIGVGRFATVYRAREVGTDRAVALKLLNVRDAAAGAVASFERESVALGAVSSHPNIVTLYRSFRAVDGRPVLVLELCRGALSDRLREGRGLPVQEAVAVGIKIAAALETAHRAEILHCDVRPQTVLVSEYGEPALADFGVATLQSASRTTAGLFHSTAVHAAPELLEGGDVSAATDVYGLAATLYELIAGRPAFRAYDGESPASVGLRILRDPVAALRDPAVPVALSDLLVQAMAKDPQQRPQSAAEFAGALRQVEAAQGWPATPFLVRTASGSAHPPAAPVVATPVVAAPVAPRPAPIPVESSPDPARPTPPPPRPPAAPPAPAPPPPPAASPPRRPAPAPPRRPVRIDDEDESPDDDLIAAAPAYPIPPRAPQPEPAEPPRPRPPAPPVPTWASRAATPAPQPAPEPASEPGGHRTLRIRRGSSALIVDDTRLALRRGLHRTELDWQQVRGFAPRFEGRTGGRLVVLTDDGPLDLPATERASAELRVLHAELESFRQRAQRHRA
jgi:serine/threonine protein kinase